jgi:hypothetical protein
MKLNCIRGLKNYVTLLHKFFSFILLLHPFIGQSQPSHYSFTTKWQIRAPLEKVWDVIERDSDWPLWWKGVEKAEVLDAGDSNGIGQIIHYEVKSFLPFILSFDYKVTTKETYKTISGVASGDLEGIGVWTFEENNGITYVQYDWNVVSTKKIVNLLSPVLKCFFNYNHNLVMHWGAKRLAKKLHARLLKG